VVLHDSHGGGNKNKKGNVHADWRNQKRPRMIEGNEIGEGSQEKNVKK
jgi:hypothetical protein